MTKAAIVKFEDFIKTQKALYLGKVFEKQGQGWKLIYNIQGLTVDAVYYANLKFIFWLDGDKEQLTDAVVSYLYTQYCDYKSIAFNDENIVDQVKTALSHINAERTNTELSGFVIDGTDGFNAEIKRRGIADFVQNIKWINHKDKSCPDTEFKFEMETNDKKFEFHTKCFKQYWELHYNGEKENIQFKDIHKKVIDLVYGTDRNNV